MNVIQILTDTLFRASERFQIPHLVLAGGVSANTKLRSALQERALSEGKTFLAPTQSIYSQDNAAMIGIRAYYEYNRKNVPYTVK